MDPLREFGEAARDFFTAANSFEGLRSRKLPDEVSLRGLEEALARLRAAHQKAVNAQKAYVADESPEERLSAV